MIWIKDELIEDDRLLSVQKDLLGFLVDEVINPKRFLLPRTRI
jgi:hypothetical protein